MQASSSWAANATLFNQRDQEKLFSATVNDYRIEVYVVYNNAWVVVTEPDGMRVAIRCAYAPASPLEILDFVAKDFGGELKIKAAFGIFHINIEFAQGDFLVLHMCARLELKKSMHVPYWPRDLTILAKEDDPAQPVGKVHIGQAGTRSGLQFFTVGEVNAQAVLYFQNLTSLNQYFESTKTSAADVVGGKWPELGFALPKTTNAPMTPSTITLSDAYIAFVKVDKPDEIALAKVFLDLLASVYLRLPRPQTHYHEWQDILRKGLHDLQNSHGCWSHANGHDYLNAYLCDYDTPPESMVQLAILLPLLDYHRWSKEDLPAVKKIKPGISAFYNAEIGTMMRWLPALEDTLDGSEEQLKPDVMDAWYLHHPLLNLGRLALQGDAQAKQLFIGSLPFTIKVARHFKYNWPVFYHMKTLEIVKKETRKGEGGEKDVAGLYAHVMLQAWDVTKDAKYLKEAEKAAKTLKNKGFKLFYQANNTAFAANAMLRLYRETGKKLYHDLSYLCLANIFKNMHLWECKYGYGKHYPTFFGIFPLNDAPYTAAYEEQEVFAAFHELLKLIIPHESPALNIFIPEFIRNIVYRAAYYFPPNLPAEMLAEKVKMGQLDQKLWIAIEDLNDGWEKSGAVGQEVYGAGVAFGIVPRHYHFMDDSNCFLYVDYPIQILRRSGKDIFSFKVIGDSRLSCRMMLVKRDRKAIRACIVTAGQGKSRHEVAGRKTRAGHVEYLLYGEDIIHIAFK